eukprot:superscaffoldBa00004734_g19367
MCGDGTGASQGERHENLDLHRQLATYRQEVEAHTVLVIQHIMQLGFSINPSKSTLQPSQQIRSDNNTVVAYLNRQGGVKSLALHRMVVSILTWADGYLCCLKAHHIPRSLNMGANRMSKGVHWRRTCSQARRMPSVPCISPPSLVPWLDDTAAPQGPDAASICCSCDTRESGPLITQIVNFSIQTGSVPSARKVAVIHPVLKKPTLDPEVLACYRPNSTLPFLSKLLERVAKELQNCSAGDGRSLNCLVLSLLMGRYRIVFS